MINKMEDKLFKGRKREKKRLRKELINKEGDDIVADEDSEKDIDNDIDKDKDNNAEIS